MPAWLGGGGAGVTGAGRGIGRALAARLAAEGAQVVVNDLDPMTASAVADAIGGAAVPGDACSADGVHRLITQATEELGRVDIYVANAGIGGAGADSLQTADEHWERCLDVNVMASVRAARLLVPRWLQDGGGRFVVTASAAGLLTMLGDAPYSVTKHAVVGFAEWLSATYGHRGIAVHAICPQGVRTRMLEDAGPLQQLLTRDAALEPEQIADSFMTALDDDRFLVLPHPEVADYYVARADDTDRWLAGMRRLQQRLDEQMVLT